MLGTLTLAAGTAAAGWLLQHAYQHMRYSFYEREDTAMLAPGADPAERRDWLAAIGAQVAIQAVAPSTISDLAASGDIDADLLAIAESGAYARRYNPTLAGEAYWAPAYLAAALAGAAYSPAAAVAAASSLAITASDIRFRIVPIPHLAVLAVSSVAAFCPTPAGAALTAAGMALTWALGAAVRRIGGEWGDVDSLMLGCVLGSTATTPLIIGLVPALGAAALLFIACSRRIGVKTDAMPLAPIISLALIAALAAGALS